MINIDLKLLKKLNININEYLTILKINAHINDSDIPFIINPESLNTLEQKEYIKSNDQSISLTSKAMKHFKLADKITNIIDYFKEITGKTKISSISISNRKYIKDRLDQGYTEEDLKKVVDIKYNEWKNDNVMKQYIRIETLFNQEKFQKYIGEVESNITTEKVGSNINVKRI